MIDLDKAREVFREYVDQFDSSNGKINLKINHIYRVADISRKIAVKINMNEEEQDLAELIGLLHDIGRFMQVKLYNTFNDGKSVNHAEMGSKVLFEDGLIYKFLEDRKYDDIIKTAILNHNKDRIDGNISGKMLDFCKIIRDADKTDIFYVLCTEDFADSYGRADMSQDLISDEILREFKEDRIINYKERKSGADNMVSHFAYVFDFNYSFCLQFIREKGYIEKLVNRAGFKNEDTIKKMKEIVAIANSYIDEKGKE
ncbi:MAG: HD domain-containing protein [Clostridia bacterium]|nr:HD domain-containing protein [Clostridia bacterium]